MSDIIYRLYLKFVVAQFGVLVFVLIAISYMNMQNSRQNAEIYLRANFNDLLLGDFRQAATSLRMSLQREFQGVRVESPLLGKVLDIGRSSDASLFFKTLAFPISLDQKAKDPMKIIFVYDYSRELKKYFLLGLMIIALNSAIFFVLRFKIEDVVDRKAESSRLRELGNLAKSVAHDVRSPLSVIQIGAQKITPTHAELGMALGLAVKRIDDIASELLKNYSQEIHGTENSMSMKECLFQAQNIAKELQSRFPKLQINLSADNSVVAQIHLSVLHWQRILANVLNNSAEADASKISINLRTLNADMLNVEITDDGRGMTSKSLQSIRKRRFRSWNKFGGHGIGLRSCIEVIEANGGSWTINSELGRGVDFKFNLPMQNGFGINV